MASGTKLFVGGLAWETTDKTLHDSFKEFGDIVSAMVVIDRSTRRSKGYGFVTFGDATTAQKAVDEMKGKDIDGRAIRVDFASNQEGGAGPSRRRDSDSGRTRDAPYQRREYSGGGRDRGDGGRRNEDRGDRGERGYRGNSRGGGRSGFRNRNDSADG